MARRNGFGPLGSRKYVPYDIMEELKNIQKEDGIKRDCNAFKEMAKYSKVGREINKMRNRFFLNDIWGKNKK